MSYRHHRDRYRQGDRQGGDDCVGHRGRREGDDHQVPHSSEVGEKPIFPCASCMSALATKRLASGEIVKRWPDDLCPTCWAAEDIIAHRGKYPGLTDRLVELLGWFEREELVLLLRPETCSTLYGDLLGGLYYLTGDLGKLPERDWEGEIEELRRFIKSVKAFPLPVLRQLHKRLVPEAA